MQRPVWQTGDDGRISDGELHVWMSRRPAGNRPPVASGLTAAELKRCESLRFEEDQSRCCARRGLLRRVLARYLRMMPSDVRLQARPGGRLEFAEDVRSNLTFSVSSSKDVVLVAVAAGMEVGVDVEVVRDLPELPRLATHALGDIELGELQRVAPADATRWFLQRWTNKEAVLKGLGTGLRLDPRDVTVSLNSEDACIGRVLSTDSGSDWFITELEVAENVVGALASHRKPTATAYYLDEW
jgi:4'-phosphopantetheinyl transferase